ncbi:tetraacyldisaccharide 4'-kinase [Croceimicrobium sp.]|uniref:tetraacyldisaccharide 4'-kinase n=1 Tax=Croceimicrobium sp. TaxID=2828340 RepID=UPI003BA90B91
MNPALKILLRPLGMLYDLITTARNRAFDEGRLESYQSKVPSIAIGNLSMGGTGKTPFTEFLIQNLDIDPKAVVSRGYGRKSRGLLEVDPNGSAEDFGDEALQIAQKFPVRVWVSEKRKAGVLAAEEAGAKLILLDDAFQHRYVKAHRYLMLSRFDQPFFNDYVVPAGYLRESRKGAERADFIIFTKCPANLNASLRQRYMQATARYTKAQVLFSELKYGKIRDQFGNELEKGKALHLITGIADTKAMIEYLEMEYSILKNNSYRDHHAFRETELKSHLAEAKKAKAALLCTDKDRVKLGPLLDKIEADYPLYSLPVEHVFKPADQSRLLSDLKSLFS